MRLGRAHARSVLLAGAVALAVLAACSGDDAATTPAPVRPGSTTLPGSPPAAPPSTSAPPTAASTAATTPAAAAPTSAAAPATSAPVPAEPLALGARIAAVEAAVRDPATPAAAVAEAGREQQRLYREWAGRPEWDDTVLAAVPEPLRAAVARNLDARRVVVEAARRRTAPLPPTIPAWSIAEPLPPAQLVALYREAEAATGVPWAYLAAINLVETRMGRVVGASSAGAVGPMQFLPTTWAECCEGDVNDPADAIRGAARYLVMRGAPGDMQRALYGYNPSDSYVASVTRYAENMLEDERAYLGYHAWQVIVGTSAGAVRLPVGFTATEPVDAAAHLAAHPEDRA